MRHVLATGSECPAAAQLDLGTVSVSAWEAIFMLVVLKIPVIYLAAVVWWAVRAEPEGPPSGEEIGVLVPLAPCDWNDRKRRRPRRLGQGPARARRLGTRARVTR